jgi:hypothetical protein
MSDHCPLHKSPAGLLAMDAMIVVPVFVCSLLDEHAPFADAVQLSTENP